MALNDNFDFASADATVRRAFLRPPEKLLLKQRVAVYKWTDNPLYGGVRITPWWSFVETHRLPSGAIVEGFRVLEERARRIKATHRAFARTRAAISEDFGNSMASLLVAQLDSDVWAWAGYCSGQPEFAKDRKDLQNVFLIGGAHQVWIPNLTPRDIHEIKSFA